MQSTVWKGRLTFGLVSIPVRLYRAARRKTVRLRYLRPRATEASRNQPEEIWPEAPKAKRPLPITGQRGPTAGPVPLGQTRIVERPQQVLASAGHQTPIPRSDLLRGYEYAPEQYAILQREELRQLRIPTSSEMQILQFVRLSEIDPIYLETSYYVGPDKGGEKGYAILFEALRHTGYVALSQVSMHGKSIAGK